MNRPHPTASLVLLLGLGSAPAAAGQLGVEPSAPGPFERIAGSLVLGSGDLESLAADVFLARAGEGEARLLLLAPEREPDAEARAAPWLERGAPAVEVVSTAGEPDGWLPRFAGATGAWLEGELSSDALAGPRGQGLGLVLREFLDRGGVVAAAGRGAEQLAGAAPGLGLLPGAALIADYRPERDRARVLALLEDRPGRVVLTVEPDTALVLYERFFRAVGSGSVRAFVAAGGGRPLREDVIRGRVRGDLVALTRAALARTGPAFPPAEPPPPRVASGSLVIAGGGPLPAGLLERFIELSGGPEATIVYVPCAYAERLEREPGFLRSLRAAGAENATWIHTKDRARADGDEDFLAPLAEAGGVWFGGGRQWNFVDSYQDTRAHRLMQAVLDRGGAIGGSSAGASIQADYMARGNPLGNLDIMAEGYERGLGFLTGVAIDQHFTQRGRQPDMSSLVDTYPQLLGIGLDEGTALVVQGSVAEVVAAGGARHVYFYDRGKPAPEEGPDWERLGAGGRYELAERRVLGE